MITTSIKRVVSSFILSGSSAAGAATATREDLRIAVFHRVDTMPTFASHWAACSGSIEPEDDPTPWHAAHRELHEETNLPTDVQPDRPGGLFVDVPFRKTQDRETIIRVYPFTVHLPHDYDWKSLELRGTEHDTFKFVSVAELEQLRPAVPGLAQAFHHATFGKYHVDAGDPSSSKMIQNWAADRENGAAVMAQNAVRLVAEQRADPSVLKMMRPSMVAITNAMEALVIDNKERMTPNQVLESMQRDAQASIDYAVQTIRPWIIDHHHQQQRRSGLLENEDAEPYVIATHSRSSTVVAVLQQLLLGENDDYNGYNIRILCGKSTPGDEGELMARHDLAEYGAVCVDDEDLRQAIRQKAVHLLLTGCDCLTEKDVINKVGTLDLATIAHDAATTTNEKPTKVVCCVDRWKMFDDIFPPPLEDIFECVPRELFDSILLPPPSKKGPDQCDAVA